MLELRASGERGHANHGWLQSAHSFSFAGYYDPRHVEFGPLRVINEDRVAPARGFDAHSHRDMEILSYVLDGELEHRDSMGNGSVIRPGDLQRMSAGRGVTHSERNASLESPVHFLQIWIHPDRRGLEPGYQQKFFAPEEKRGRLRLIASSSGEHGSVSLNQDVRLYAGLFDGSEHAGLALAPTRCAYVHLARGAVAINGKPLAAGDGLKIRELPQIELADGRAAEILVFDLPAFDLPEGTTR